MNIVLVGVSHKSAPVEVRERVAFPAADLAPALPKVAALAEGGGRGEVMIVSTCNRVEMYLAGAGDLAGHARRTIATFIAGERGMVASDIEPHLYTESGEAALRHLFRVASSLDSVVVGEPQILGQVKDAFEAAQKAGTIGQLLSQIVPRAFGAAKRVRSETEIARSSASVASVAVDLSKRIFGDLVGRDVLVVGAGEMGELAAKHLVSSGAGQLHIVNRTRSRGDELRARIIEEKALGLKAVEAHGWDALPAMLVRADVVVCATGASDPVISRDMVKAAMKARRGRWLCLLDIAVPRDVEPEAGEIENVYLYDVDALTRIVDENLEGRRREAEAAERIVGEEVARCRELLKSRGAVPTIKALREHFGAVAHAEAQRTLARLGAVSDKDKKAVEMLADSIVNKLLHHPLMALKKEDGAAQLIAAARALFDLHDAPESSEGAASDGKSGHPASTNGASAHAPAVPAVPNIAPAPAAGPAASAAAADESRR